MAPSKLIIHLTCVNSKRRSTGSNMPRTPGKVSYNNSSSTSASPTPWSMLLSLFSALPPRCCTCLFTSTTSPSQVHTLKLSSNSYPLSLQSFSSRIWNPCPIFFGLKSNPIPMTSSFHQRNMSMISSTNSICPPLNLCPHLSVQPPHWPNMMALLRYQVLRAFGWLCSPSNTSH